MGSTVATGAPVAVVDVRRAARDNAPVPLFEESELIGKTRVAAVEVAPLAVVAVLVRD